MGEYRGVVSHVAEDEGRIRLYLAESVGEFIDFDLRRASVVEPDSGTSDTWAVYHVEIDDDAVEQGSIDRDLFEQWFSQPDSRTLDGVDRFARAVDLRDRERSLDGSQFRCCYTIVYD